MSACHEKQMTPEQLKEVPRDLHSLQYAAWLCENTLGVPAVESNLKVMSQAIESISKAKFRDKPRPAFTAFLWLERQCVWAKLAAIPTNHLFFLNGDYNEVPEPEKKLPEFVPCKDCSGGWKTIEKDGKKRVTRCECWRLWRSSVA